jgi:hypothetical protein
MTELSALIERVAGAIADAMADAQVATPAPIHIQRWQMGIAKVLARAAIAAMREPTEAMCEAAMSDRYQTIGAVWGGMIDAALAEEP